ncbi:hypothetical protein Tco_0321883 [Tanacetum coccineum]
MGIGIRSEEVEYAASVLGCSTFSLHFVHLGVKVDGAMTRINSWDEVISKVSSRLFKWKVKTLSVEAVRNLIDDSLCQRRMSYSMVNVITHHRLLSFLGEFD